MNMSENTCLECDGTLVPQIVDLEGSRNGEEFTVRVPGLFCEACGFKTIDNEHSGEFTKALSDAYRSAHHLLTGPEIRGRRRSLRMAQQPFAEYLGVSPASVKRWEAGSIQDRAMDELMRLKTDPEAARVNLRALEFQVPEEYVLSTVKLGEEDLDLRFSLEQNFTKASPMKMSRVRMESMEQEEPLAA